MADTCAGAELPRNAEANLSSVLPPAIVPGKVAIELVPSPNNDSSLTFDWRAVDVDSNRSFGCTIASDVGRGLTVEIEQGLYERTLRGIGEVQIGVIPLAEPGARGKLVAREDETGATAEFTWRWRAAAGAELHVSLAGRLKASFSRALGYARLRGDAVRDPLGGAGVPATDRAIDGEWQCQPYTGPPYALRIRGDAGVATLSNAPGVFAPGDTILQIDRRRENGFSGRLLYTHGRFLRIEAVLYSPDTIRFTAPGGQGGDYERSGTWTRRTS